MRPRLSVTRSTKKRHLQNKPSIFRAFTFDTRPFSRNFKKKTKGTYIHEKSPSAACATRFHAQLKLHERAEIGTPRYIYTYGHIARSPVARNSSYTLHLVYTLPTWRNNAPPKFRVHLQFCIVNRLSTGNIVGCAILLWRGKCRGRTTTISIFQFEIKCVSMDEHCIDRVHVNLLGSFYFS